MKQSKIEKHVYFKPESPLTADEKAMNVTASGWYFVDETEAYYHGPFATEDEAITRLGLYVDHLKGK